MSNVIRRCRECGVGEVRPLARAGRRGSYKNLEIEIPADLKIPTCNNCGAEWMDRATAVSLDAALEKVYRAVLRKLWATAMRKIQQKLSMRRLEQLLGLSEGYLSKVSKGRSEPSAELVAHLGTLSTDVEGRTRELEHLWKNAGQLARHGKAA